MPAQTAVIKAETSAAATGTASPDRRFSQPPGSCRHAAPAASDAAGQPALLPAAAVLALQPVQQCPQRAGLPGPQAGQMLVHLLAGLRAGGPVRGRRPRRETGPRGPVTRQPHRRRPLAARPPRRSPRPVPEQHIQALGPVTRRRAGRARCRA